MLMSTKEILGYTIQATDGEIGQVSDFLVDDHFKLRYLVIDTGKWLPGKKVALSTAWISTGGRPLRSAKSGETRGSLRSTPAGT